MPHQNETEAGGEGPLFSPEQIKMLQTMPPGYHLHPTFSGNHLQLFAKSSSGKDLVWLGEELGWWEAYDQSCDAEE